jgi:hypothetical protein
MNPFFQLTENLVDTNNDLLYKGLAIPTVVEMGLVHYVSPYGNDSTAKYGRIDRPWRTIQAAISAIPDSSSTWVVVLPGTYDESVSTGNRRGLYGGIFLQAGVYWKANVGYVFQTNDAHSFRITGAGKLYCTIHRYGSGTGGAILLNGYYAESYLEGINVIAEVGKGIENAYWLKSCNVKSTADIAVKSYGYVGLNMQNCLVESTISIGLEVGHLSTIIDSVVKGQTYGMHSNNHAGLKARNSYFYGITEKGYFGYNWNAAALIEGCTFRGYKMGAHFGTYGYGDFTPHVMRNTNFIVDDPAAPYAAECWFLNGFNIMSNKPISSNMPNYEAGIHLVENFPFVDYKHTWNYTL